MKYLAVVLRYHKARLLAGTNTEKYGCSYSTAAVIMQCLSTLNENKYNNNDWLITLGSRGG